MLRTLTPLVGGGSLVVSGSYRLRSWGTRLLGALLLVMTGTGASAASPQTVRTAQTSPAPLPLTVADVAKQNTPSVVTITTPGGTGSGVIIDPSGVVVTNLHVLRGETRASVRLANGDVYDDVSVVDVDERRDILLIKIKAFGLTPAKIGDSDRASVGNRVTLIGSPRGLDLTVSDGVLSAIRDSGDGYKMLQTSAPASPGSSGGGMFNDSGELIGIVTSKVTNGENLNFALPINYVRGLSGREARMTLAELAARFPASAPANDKPVDASNQQPPTDNAAENRLAALFKSSGLMFTNPSASVWLVQYEGGVDVYAYLVGDLFVANSTVAKSPSLTQEQLQQLLAINFSADLGKLSLDMDRDLVAINETEARLLDVAALQKLLDGIALIAGQAAKVVQGQLANETRPALTMSRMPGVTTLDLNPNGAAILYKPLDWVKEPASATAEPGVRSNQFRHSGGEVWVATISERLEISLDRLLEIGHANTKTVDPAAKVTRRGTRVVNGVSMLFQEIEAELEGILVSYYAHYYSDGSGTYQLVGWTTRNLLATHRSTIEAFVTGFRPRGASLARP